MSLVIRIGNQAHTCFPRVSGDEPTMRPRTFAGFGSFPRVSGDEPETMALPFSFQAFSPRERG